MIFADYWRQVGANSIVSLHRLLFEKFRRDCRSPEYTSAATLRDILHGVPKDLQLMFGGFTDLLKQPADAVSNFSKTIPITQIESFQGWIDALKTGKSGSWQNKSLKMFGLTSGTTGASKFIPINSSFLKSYRRAWKLWGFQAFTAHPQAAHGRFLQFGSPWQNFKTSGGTWCGSMSGLTMAMQPRMVREKYALPVDVAAIDDVRERFFLAARHALACDDISFICTANPLTLINFARWTKQRIEPLLRDIHDGGGRKLYQNTSAVPLHHTQSLMQNRRGLANPQRAKQLEKIFALGDDVAFKQLWPQLALVSVWTGGSMSHYLPVLKKLIGEEIAIRDPGFLATEGYFAIPLQDNSPDGVLNIQGHYFEFIPVDTTESDARTLLPHELIPGQSYEIIVTSRNGLMRYRMNDVVQCTGFWECTPLIRFLHKGKDISSLAGEKISALQVSLAIEELVKMRPTLDPCQALLVPNHKTQIPSYILRSNWGNEGIELAGKLDICLQKLNSEYRDRRRSERLGPITWQATDEGFFRSLEKKFESAQGAAAEQRKVPVLLTEIHQPSILLANVG